MQGMAGAFGIQNASMFKNSFHAAQGHSSRAQRGNVADSLMLDNAAGKPH
jgi:hypothetical protein